eukprot:4937907-Ditylum_brightwellii.AAC.1
MLANEALKIEPNMSVERYSVSRMDAQGSLKLKVALNIKLSEENELKQEKTQNVTRSEKQLNGEECLDKQGRLHREAIKT